MYQALNTSADDGHAFPHLTAPHATQPSCPTQPSAEAVPAAIASATTDARFAKDETAVVASPPLTPTEIVPMLIGATVGEVEQELVLQTLAHCDGNRTHAAKVLGISVRTLRNKIRGYSASGIAVPAHV